MNFCGYRCTQHDYRLEVHTGRTLVVRGAMHTARPLVVRGAMHTARSLVVRGAHSTTFSG